MNGNGDFIIAAPQAVAAKLGCIFEKAQMKPSAVYLSGEDAIAAEGDKAPLLVTTWKLDDMTGVELAGRLGQETDVLMIVPQDYSEDEELPVNVMPLHNPISPEALAQSVRVLAHCRVQMGALRSRCTPEKLLGVLAHAAQLTDTPSPISARELASVFSWEKLRKDSIFLDTSALE